MSEVIDEYLIDIKEYKIIKKITSGGYGKIYLICNIKTGNYYVAKTNKPTNEHVDILNEINILIHVQHPTIIRFHGYSTVNLKGQNKTTFIMDYKENGSLLDLIEKEQRSLLDPKFDNTNRQIILIGIAYGMVILHKNDIIHRDLKPSNVLLDEFFRPYISDFGLSKFFDSYNSSDQSVCNCGTKYYMAPEVIDSFTYNRKADVYSFGILMYEVVFGKNAFKNVKTTSHKFYNQILDGLRPEFDMPINKNLRNMIEKCWSPDPKKRPTFIEIFWKLSLVKDEELAEYEDLKELKMIDYEPVLLNEEEEEYCLENVDKMQISDYLYFISQVNAKVNKEETKWLETNETSKQILSLNPKDIVLLQDLKKDDIKLIESFLKKIFLARENLPNGSFYFPINVNHLKAILKRKDIFKINGVFEIFSLYSFYTWIYTNLLIMKMTRKIDFSILLEIFNYIIKIANNDLTRLKYKLVSISCFTEIICLTAEKNLFKSIHSILDQIQFFFNQSTDFPKESDKIINLMSKLDLFPRNEFEDHVKEIILIVNNFLKKYPDKLSNYTINSFVDITKKLILSLDTDALELFSKFAKYYEINDFNDILKQIFIKVLTTVISLDENSYSQNDLIEPIILNEFLPENDSDCFHPPLDLYQIDKIDHFEINIKVQKLDEFINIHLYPIILIIKDIIMSKEEYAQYLVQEAFFDFKCLVFYGKIKKEMKNKYFLSNNYFFKQCAIIFYLISSVIKKYSNINIRISENENSSLFDNEYIFNPHLTYFTNHDSKFQIVNSLRHIIFLFLLKKFPKLLDKILIEKSIYPVLFNECVCRLVSILNNFNEEKETILLTHLNFIPVTNTLISSLFNYRFNSNQSHFTKNDYLILKARKTILVFITEFMFNDDALNMLFWSPIFIKYFFILLLEPPIRHNFVCFLIKYLGQFYSNKNDIYQHVKLKNNIFQQICDYIIKMFGFSFRYLPPHEALLLNFDLLNALNEAMKVNDSLYDTYEQVSSIFYQNIMKYEYFITEDKYYFMNEETQKTILNYFFQVIAPSSEIKQAKVLPIIFNIFLKTKYIYDIIKSILDLCDNLNNCIKCHDCKLDLFIINIFHKWKKVDISIIPENNEEIILSEDDDRLIVNEKLIKLFLQLFMQVSSVLSSVSIVAKFMYLLHPIDEQYLTKFQIYMFKFLSQIVCNAKHFPFMAMPLLPLKYSRVNELLDNGICLVFWISSFNVEKMLSQNLITLNIDSNHKFITQLTKEKFIMTIQSKNKGFEYSFDLLKNDSIMITISASKENNKTLISIYVENELIDTFYDFPILTPILALESIFDAGRKSSLLYLKGHPFKGPFLITKQLTLYDIDLLKKEGPNPSCSHLILYAYNAGYRGENFNFFPIRNHDEFENKNNHLKAHDKLYSFIDFLIHYHESYLILPVFRLFDMSFKCELNFQLKPDFCCCLFFNLFSLGDKIQCSFIKFKIFYAVSYLILSTNKSMINYDLYIGLYKLLEVITYDNLQMQLIDGILMNIEIWSRSKISQQNLIFDHWNRILYPHYQSIVDQIKTIEWYLYTISCFYYDISKQNDNDLKKCRKSLFYLIYQSLKANASNINTTLVLNLICSKESSMIEKKDMLLFLSKIFQNEKVKFGTDILDNQIIPFLRKIYLLPFKDDDIISQVIVLYIIIFKYRSFEMKSQLNILMYDIVVSLHIKQRYVFQKDIYYNLVILMNSENIIELLPILCINAILGGTEYIVILISKIDRFHEFQFTNQIAVYPSLLLFTFYNQRNIYYEVIKLLIHMYKNHINMLIDAIKMIACSWFDINIGESILHDVLYIITKYSLIPPEKVNYLINIIKDFIFYRPINSNLSILERVMNKQDIDLLINSNIEEYSMDFESDIRNIDFELSEEYSCNPKNFSVIENLKEIISNDIIFQKKFGFRFDHKNVKWIDLELAKQVFLIYKKFNAFIYNEFISVLSYFIQKHDKNFANEINFFLLSFFPEQKIYSETTIDINDYSKIEKVVMLLDDSISNQIFNFRNDFISLYNEVLLLPSTKSIVNTDVGIKFFINEKIELRNKNKILFNNLWNNLRSLYLLNNDGKCKRENSFCFAHYQVKNKINNDFLQFDKDSLIQNVEYMEHIECKLVRIEGEKDATIFINNREILISIGNKTIIIPSFDIDSIYYLYKHHKYQGIQIFTKTRKNYSLLFENHYFRILICRISCFPDIDIGKIQRLNSFVFVHSLYTTEDWQNGKISNFEYLMFLNILSGRTFNDVSQYPIFPWVIRDFSSLKLDLNSELIYRDLSKSMIALNTKRINEFLGHNFVCTRYYSNPSSVHNFLIRLEPFSSQYINENNEDEIDCPFPIFNSIADAYKSATKSLNDFNELIPEFFFLPKFLKKHQQNNGLINDVILPPWANNSAIEFIYLNRKALESKYVSIHLSEWIDLIWGYKQDGKEAFNANNKFSDELYQSIWKTSPNNPKMIKEIQLINGQVPLILFSEEHPKRQPFLPRSSILFFKIKDDYDALINAMEKQILYVNIKFYHVSPIISCEISIDKHNHRFSFTYFDQDGSIYNNFVDFNLLRQNELDLSTKKKNGNFYNLGFWKGKNKLKNFIKSGKISLVKFVDSDIVCIVVNNLSCLVVNCKTENVEKIIEKNFDIISIETNSDGWLGISSNDSVVEIYRINGLLNSLYNKYSSQYKYSGQVFTYKEPINCIAMNPLFCALILGTRDNYILFSSLDINKLKIKKAIEISGKPINIVITDTFGFIIVSMLKYKKGVEIEKLVLFSINGEKIRSCKLDNCKRIVAITKTTSFPGSFDYLIVADNENYVFVFEAFYMILGNPIFKCESRVIKLSYIKEECLIIVVCEDGTASIIYYPIVDNICK